MTLVSDSNYLLFTPMLAEVASSALEPQHISAPVRAAAARTRFLRARVESVDLERRLVAARTTDGGPLGEIPYDHLVLALGSVPDFFGLPGMEKHAFTLKTLEDAARLRNRVIGLLEHADSEVDPKIRRHLLTFAVAGGGFGGVEIVAELFDLVRAVLRFYPNIDRDDPHFLLVHGGDMILPELDRRLGEYALRKLQARGIEFHLSTRVGGAEGEALLLADGRRIPAATVVWTAGNRPNPVLRALACERDRRGAVVVDSTMRATGFDNVWAIGDCAAIPDPGSGGRFYPPTAQHALREGRKAADNIRAVIRGRKPRPFRYRAFGMLCSLGRRQAAAQFWGLRVSGLVAWLMWRSIYWVKLPGIERKVRVALDWAVDLVLPRDIVLTQLSAPTLLQPAGAQQEPVA